MIVFALLSRRHYRMIQHQTMPTVTVARARRIRICASGLRKIEVTPISLLVALNALIPRDLPLNFRLAATAAPSRVQPAFR